MRLLPLFSKPRNDKFYGILKFPRLKIPPNPQKRRDPSVKPEDDIVGNSRIPRNS